MEAAPAEADAAFTWGAGAPAARAPANQGGADANDSELADAKSWDALLGYCYEMRPFEENTQTYKDKRAVAAFNKAGPMTQEYKRLKPNAEAAVCHATTCVIPRQMQKHGDPTRRGADHGEALGASIKDDIHNRCLRRKKSTKSRVHEVKDEHGNVVKTYTQSGLSVSRIAQIWRNMAVRDKLLAEAESERYLQRTHYKVAKTGFASGGHAAAASRRKAGDTSIFELVKEARENA